MKGKLFGTVTLISFALDLLSVAERLLAFGGKVDMRVMLEIGIGIIFITSLSIYLHEKYKNYKKALDERFQEERQTRSNMYSDLLTKINQLEDRVKK